MMTFNRPPFHFAVATLAVVGIACSSNTPSGSFGQGTGGASGGALATGTGGKAGAAGATSGTGGRGSGGGTAGGVGGLASGGSGASSSALGGHGSGGGGVGSGGSGVGGTGGSGGSVTGGSGGSVTGGSGGSVTGGSGGGVTGGSGGSATGGSGGSATGGSGGSSAGGSGGSTVGALVQAYDGARGKSFNDGWKFYRGDASGAEQTTFNDTSWRSLSVPHDWSIELPFNKNSPAGNGGGLLDGGVGWYRKTFTLDSVLFRPADPDRVRRRVHEQPGVDQRHLARNAALRLLDLPVRSYEIRKNRRQQQRHRGPGQQQPAEQPLVLRQRHLSQRLAHRPQSGPRRLQRSVRHDSVGERDVCDGLDRRRRREPIEQLPVGNDHDGNLRCQRHDGRKQHHCGQQRRGRRDVDVEPEPHCFQSPPLVDPTPRTSIR